MQTYAHGCTSTRSAVYTAQRGLDSSTETKSGPTMSNRAFFQFVSTPYADPVWYLRYLSQKASAAHLRRLLDPEIEYHKMPEGGFLSLNLCVESCVGLLLRDRKDFAKRCDPNAFLPARVVQACAAYVSEAARHYRVTERSSHTVAEALVRLIYDKGVQRYVLEQLAHSRKYVLPVLTFKNTDPTGFGAGLEEARRENKFIDLPDISDRATSAGGRGADGKDGKAAKKLQRPKQTPVQYILSGATGPGVKTAADLVLHYFEVYEGGQAVVESVRQDLQRVALAFVSRHRSTLLEDDVLQQSVVGALSDTVCKIVEAAGSVKPTSQAIRGFVEEVLQDGGSRDALLKMAAKQGAIPTKSLKRRLDRRAALPKPEVKAPEPSTVTPDTAKSQPEKTADSPQKESNTGNTSGALRPSTEPAAPASTPAGSSNGEAKSPACISSTESIWLTMTTEPHKESGFPDPRDYCEPYSTEFCDVTLGRLLSAAQNPSVPTELTVRTMVSGYPEDIPKLKRAKAAIYERVVRYIRCDFKVRIPVYEADPATEALAADVRKLLEDYDVSPPMRHLGYGILESLAYDMAARLMAAEMVFQRSMSHLKSDFDTEAEMQGRAIRAQVHLAWTR